MAPFLFNLFAEGLHWILQSWLQWDLLDHYLDDFILIIPLSSTEAELLGLSQTAKETYWWKRLFNGLGLDTTGSYHPV